MASLSCTYHLLSCSAYARLSHVQPAPASSIGGGGGHQNDGRHEVYCQLAFTSTCPQNLRNNSFKCGCQHAGKFRTRRRTVHVWRSCESSLESFETRTGDSTSSHRVSKALKSRIVKPSTETRETQEVVPATENAAWRIISGHALGALLTGTLLIGVHSAEAVDPLKTCSCLLKECRVELARCIADPGCAANVACLQTCNNRPDETECQIACGDLFQNSVVDEFNDCALSRKGCVPRKKDQGEFPAPPPTALVQDFSTLDLSGKWYITRGLNRSFDTFDCQLHEFTGAPKEVSVKLAWRIPTPDGGFITRSAVQDFVQDNNQPGILRNHGNEYLHYQDDWYILAAKLEKSADDYIFVYYRGSNDAWDGYGGAVVYTRSKTLPLSIIPDLTSAAKLVGLDFNKFSTTDNSCGPQPPLSARLEETAEQGQQYVAEKTQQGEQYIVEKVEEKEMFLLKELKQVVNSVGRFLGNIVKGEVHLFNRAEEEFKRDEKLLLGDEEKALLDGLKMEARDIERLFGNSIPVRRSR